MPPPLFNAGRLQSAYGSSSLFAQTKPHRYQQGSYAYGEEKDSQPNYAKSEPDLQPGSRR